MTDQPRWAWQVKGSDTINHDTFDTRQDAVRNARWNGWHEPDIELGHLVKNSEQPDPGLYIETNADAILDQMEDAAREDRHWADEDSVFTIPNESEAQADLELVLMTWARKWIKPVAQTFVKE